ncbi:MAG TPA: S41 family peptidase [Solirubrobacteraceae bacterium]|nr:S41 family peptidase [Solirubrobacteraceae bacterium]
MTTALPTLIDALIGRLLDGYIFPARSEAAAHLLRSQLEAGAYPPTVGPELCERLSADLLRATDDKHLRLIWHDSAERSQDDVELINELRERFRRENHGVRCVEWMPGNIGVIELTVIPELAFAGPTLAAAMQMVQHTEALILDLRPTIGGSPDAVTFLASFLFPDGETRLSDIVEGPAGPARQFWTAAHLPGPRYLHRDVYALTGPNTFSGGESLAYDLQALGRATIVGEVTRGGAHPSEVVSLAEHVELRLPTARPVSPITGGNWERVGVQPDVRVAASDALAVAYSLALEAIADNSSNAEASRDEAAHAASSHSQ